MLETVEKAFAPEFLSVSHKAGRLADFAWAAFSIGGTVPVKVLEGYFPEAEEHVTALAKAGVLRYALGGFVDRDQRKLSLSVQLDPGLLALPGSIGRKEFECVLFRDYGERLVPHCRTGLTEPLAAMLTSIIFYATPEKPVFSSTIVKKASRVCLMTHQECQDMLDSYLHRCLGLVSMESGSLVNLSVRSRQRVNAHQRILAMYVSGRTEKEKRAEAPVPGIALMSEQERKVRAYFPWIKL